VKEIVIPKISKLRAVIKSISSSGKVVVSFSNNLIIPANITQIDDKVLNVQIKPGKDTLPKDVEISKWNVTGKKNLNQFKHRFYCQDNGNPASV